MSNSVFNPKFQKEQVEQLLVSDKSMNLDYEPEDIVLGVIFNSDQYADDIIRMIPHDEFFQVERNRIFYSAILKVYKKSEPIDYVTVGNELSRKEFEKCGGPSVMVELANKVGSVEKNSLHVWCKIIAENKAKIDLRKSLIQSMQGLIKGKSSDELIMKLSNELVDTTSLSTNDKPESMKDLLPEVLKKVEEAHIKKVEAEKRGEKYSTTGVPTGFKIMDAYTSGWQPGDLIILAARPGMGKSALAFDLAKNAAERGFPVGIVSYEMPNEQIISRMLSSETGINGQKILRKGVNGEELQLT